MNKLLHTSRIINIVWICISCGAFILSTAFVSVMKEEGKYDKQISEEIRAESFVSTDSVENVINESPAESLFDTSRVFEKYWHNSNLFPYSYPSAAEVPDSAYFMMRDSETQFCIPRMGAINSAFGPRWGKMHKGLDIHLKRGDAVKAALSGKVRYAQFNTGGYGNLVIIRHPNGLETYYAHLTDINTKPNAWVSAGTVIGTGGNTGAEWSGEHLHFEMRYRDRAFDPLLIIDWAKKELKSDTLVLLKKHLQVSDEFAKQTIDNKDGDPNEVNVAKTSSRNQKMVSKSSKSNRHTVMAGDTIYSIARKYGTSSSRILSLNGLTADSVLSIGEKIRID